MVAKKFMAPLPESSDLIFQSGFSYSEGENNQLISVGFRSMLLAGDRDLIAKDNSFSKQKDFSGSLIWSCTISLMVLITMFLALPMSQNLPRKGRYSKARIGRQTPIWVASGSVWQVCSKETCSANGFE